MNNDTALLALRPDLSHLYSELASDVEKFQNASLRPILKMQHDLLIALVQSFPHFTNIPQQAKSLENYKMDVIEFLKNQPALKNQILGLVIGHFTKDEWTLYVSDRTEYNKRIISMSGERVAGAVWLS